jgi:drug/metabolite transporter (DMT)-like permease
VIALGIIWGIPYLLIGIAVRDYSPVFVAFGRALMGALILLPLAFARGVLRSGFRNFGWLIAYTFAEISGPWLLIGYAELHVPTSVAGLIVALTPILAAVLSTVTAGERVSLLRAAGLILGLIGVASLQGLDSARPHWPAFAVLAVAALGYAAGPIIYAKRLSGNDPISVVTASLFVAALLYAPAIPTHWPESFSVSATIAVLALAALCTATAFLLLFALIAEVGAERSTIIAYINPAVAVLLGVSVLGEPLSAGILLGFALIIAGTYLSARRTGTGRDEAAADAGRSTARGSQ